MARGPFVVGIVARRRRSRAGVSRAFAPMGVSPETTTTTTTTTGDDDAEEDDDADVSPSSGVGRDARGSRSLPSSRRTRETRLNIIMLFEYKYKCEYF